MSYIAKMYANLISKGGKSLEDVPKNLKDEVQQLLNQEEKKGD